jgi:hypothetical protein
VYHSFFHACESFVQALQKRHLWLVLIISRSRRPLNVLTS